MQTILLVGTDPSLLSSRAALLGRTGCQTICAGVQDAAALQEQHRADLVVLCHTVPDLIAVALTRLVHERWPCTRVLQVLQHGQQESGSTTYADAVSYSRPECLLKTATDLLRTTPAPPIEISQWKASMYVQ